VGLFQNGIEYGAKLTGRGIDHLQYLGGRRLLFQCLARLGQKPRILHCNDRLCREVLQQRDLLFRKWSNLTTLGDDNTE